MPSSSGSGNTPRTVYHTSYTHSVSLTELEHVSQALICVGKTGLIEWIEKDIGDKDVERALADHGLRIGEIEVVKIDEGGIVPGLIDTHTVCLLFKRESMKLINSMLHSILILGLDHHYSSWTGWSN